MAELPTRENASPKDAPDATMKSPAKPEARERTQESSTLPNAHRAATSTSPHENSQRRSTTPNDSEAETDILSASNTNTPAKKSAAGRDGEANNPRLAKKEAKLEESPNDENDARRRQRSTPGTAKKRKVSLEVAEDHSNRGGRQNSEGSGESSGKKARLSPGSEGKDGFPRDSSNIVAPGKSGRRKSEREGADDVSGNRPHTTKRPHVPDLDLSNRAHTHEPRTRSESPRHPGHKRASSFHTSVQERERRLRPRRSSPDNERGAPETPSQSTFSGMAPKTKDVDKHGRTYLARACAEGDYERAHQILGQSLDDVDKPDYAGNTPLQIAALDGSTDIVQMLIEKGANVHCYNESGDTPLIDAVENSHIEVIKTLLEAGVDPQRRGYQGKMPLDVLPKGDLRKTIRELLHNSIKSFDAAKAPLPAPSTTARRFMTEKELHLITPSVDRLREYSANGDINAADRMIQNGVKAVNSCLVAAAAGGHVDLLSLLLAEGGVADPDPSTLPPGETTPIVAAIGRGVPEILALLLDQPGFDPRRKVRSKQYKTIARDRHGKNWEQEVKILEDAFQKAGAGAEEEVEEEAVSAPPPRRRRLVSGREAAGDRRQTQEAEESDGEPDMEPVPPGPTEEELAAQRAKERAEYLDMMPRALSIFLSEEGKLPQKKPGGEENRHKYCVNNFLPVYTVRLIEIRPDCSAEKAEELWILNFYAAVLLHHDRLDTYKTLSLDTIPCTQDQRMMMWGFSGLNMLLTQDCDWRKAPPEYMQKIPHIIFTMPSPDRRNTTYGDFFRIERQKFLDLPEDQIFWIRLKDFIAETTPEKAPQLSDVLIRNETRAHVDCVWNEAAFGRDKWRRIGEGECERVNHRNGVEEALPPVQPNSNWFWRGC